MKSKLKNNIKKLFSGVLSATMLVGMVACTESPAPASGGTTGTTTTDSSAPIKFTVTYSDNATLPFKPDWLSIQEIQKRVNADINFEIIPIADYTAKIATMLNTNTAPDVVLYRSAHLGELAAVSLNGGIVPISDYESLTPNFNNLVKEWKLEEDINSIRLKDGKFYHLPSLFDNPFYDGGLIIREDLLKKYNLEAPKTFDDLYNVLKKFKEGDPKSYPLTVLAGERVLFRFTMPSFGISLGANSASSTWTLSYDYDKKEYFAGAISDNYKAYVTYMAKLFEEGLLDPEFRPEGDRWATKLATGASMASWAYYDQIGGVEGTSKIEGFDLNMLPALEGPGGAHSQPKPKTGPGVILPSTTKKRADFDRLVSTLDEMFYKPENAELWCLGIEGKTFTKNGDKIEFVDEIKNAPEGVYKSMQLKYGMGVDVTQLVWKNSREMLKYDENYAKINKVVQDMGDVIQPLPPMPLFDDKTAEQANMYRAPLADAFDVWNDDFIRGKKSIEKDWDAYVAEMKSKNIEKYVELCNQNLRK